jgi:hypothetical protein
MKKLLLTLTLMIGFGEMYSQSLGLTYQAVILDPVSQELPGFDAENNPLANSAISIRFSIYDENMYLEYSESHSTSTDIYGMLNVVIGQGTPLNFVDFDQIVWAGEEKTLQVDIDFTASGANYEPLSTQSLYYMPHPVPNELLEQIAAIQADVDQNELDSDAADAGIQADVDQNEVDSDAADAGIQADVDQNEVDSDAADAALAADLTAVQADVDQNEVDSDAADAALAADLTAVQADVDQNEVDSDAADAGIQADVDQNELDSDAADAALAADLTAVQADIDQNEVDSDAADAALAADLTAVQADVDQNEVDSDAADAAIQADVDQNELDSDAADAVLTTGLATVQADVDQNELDSDAAESALNATVVALQALIDLLQADVDGNQQSSESADVLLTNLINAYSTSVTANTTAINNMAGTQIGQMNYWNGADWVAITASVLNWSTLRFIDGIPTWYCVGDNDNDGLCDEYDDCFGVVDACGVCNGDGSTCP